MEVEQIARALVAGDALLARCLVQEWLAGKPLLAEEPPSKSEDVKKRTLTAGWTEMFAERLGQSPPVWTSQVGSLAEPFYVIRAAETMLRTRRLCEEQSPIALRRRKIFAPPDFLKSA